MARRLVRERRARNEVADQLDYYIDQELEEVAAAFRAEYDRFCVLVLADNEIAPSYASSNDRVGALGLRMWPMRKFPHLVFYYLTPDEIRIYAVIHGAMQRDEALKP